MKKIFLITTCILIYKIGLTQCTFKDDCKVVPYPEECVDFCNSLSVILNSATESELKLIGGFKSTMTNKILNERESIQILNESGSISNIKPIEFFYKLNTPEKKSFEESLKLLNEDRAKYFNLSDKERKKVYKQLEKIKFD